MVKFIITNKPELFFQKPSVHAWCAVCQVDMFLLQATVKPSWKKGSDLPRYRCPGCGGGFAMFRTGNVSLKVVEKPSDHGFRLGIGMNPSAPCRTVKKMNVRHSTGLTLNIMVSDVIFNRYEVGDEITLA